MSTTEDRRKFLKGAGATLASLPFVGALFAPAAAAAPAAAPPVVPKVKPKLKPKALKVPDLKKGGIVAFEKETTRGEFRDTPEFAPGGVIREDANVSTWHRPYRTHVEFEVCTDAVAMMPGDVVAVELGHLAGAMCGTSQIQHVRVEEMRAHYEASSFPRMEITGTLVDKGYAPTQLFPKEDILHNTLRFEIEEPLFYRTIGSSRNHPI